MNIPVLKRVIFPLLLLLWLAWLPLALAVYTPWAYQTYCHWNPRCEHLGEPRLSRAMQELTEFFRHQRAELEPPWSAKENLHMLEVRPMYDALFGLFVLISLIFAIDLWRCSDRLQQYPLYARSSLRLALLLVLVALVLLPFFNYFWMEVFHPFLFDNDLWRTDPGDLSWYLMPKRFFWVMMLFILVVTVALNAMLIQVLGFFSRTRRLNAA